MLSCTSFPISSSMMAIYGKGAILKNVIVAGQVDRPTRLQDEVLFLRIFVKPIFWSFIYSAICESLSDGKRQVFSKEKDSNGQTNFGTSVSTTTGISL